MLSIALELARTHPAYEDMASKFFEHFIAIADAMNEFGGTGLWDETDGFYYDQIHVDGTHIPLRLRSLVGMIPLIAVEVLDQDTIDRLPGFREAHAVVPREQARHRAPHRLHDDVRRRRAPAARDPVEGAPRPRPARPCSTRSSSCRRTASARCRAAYRDKPFEFDFDHHMYRVVYAPAESDVPRSSAAIRTGAAPCGFRSTFC